MKIMVITSTRADFGIMSHLLQVLATSSTFDLKLVVTGTHLSSRFGCSINEIIADGIEISHKVEFPLECDEAGYLSESVGVVMGSFSSIIAAEKPDLLMVLGDRYEILPLVTVAVIQRIMIAHIHGGEVTLGAIDNKFRNAITQMADVHFVATANAYSRVRELCPNNQDIYYVGSLSVDKINKIKLLSRIELSKKFGWRIKGKTAIVTFHPETMSAMSPVQQVSQLIAALSTFAELFIVVTLSNADVGGQSVSRLLIEFAQQRSNVVVQSSLGYASYVSCLANFDLVIGNSSSGIIEAPTFGTPVINIGNRQAGREMARSVITVPCQKDAISNGINEILFNPASRTSKRIGLPYGKPNATCELVSILEKIAKRAVA